MYLKIEMCTYFIYLDCVIILGIKIDALIYLQYT